MIECFSAFQMHWPGLYWGGEVLTIPLMFWLAILSGIGSGLVSAWKISDWALTLIVLLLLLLSSFLLMTLIQFQLNPPYCWGDVMGQREMDATKNPQFGDMVAPTLLGILGVFLTASLGATLCKRWFRRFCRQGNAD